MGARAYRLPRIIWPKSYDIDIDTHPSRHSFCGSVTIDLEITEPSLTIEMHARELELSSARFEQETDEVPLVIELDAERERVLFRAPRELRPGAGRLFVRFKGKPSESMHGVYVAHDGEERAVCTQCEATDARAIFPCFDEPEFKARLKWTIRTGRELIALSNGVLSQVDAAGSQRTWHFEPTEPISSYLAAFVVGDFEGTDETLASDVPVRVFALRGKKHQGQFAHAFTEKLIPWYEAYFDVRYPYKKYDQVAVPGFDAGAMENVGLVLFRQNLLLMDPTTASWNQEKLIGKVIAHELAHMWFGNLVTMKWWDDLWLNEAFAEWFAHKATDVVNPSYQVWNDFQADKNRALVDDALPTTHSIWAPVETSSQALEMFDVITYQKGCAVMRMLEAFLGEEAFRNGLRTYMKAFSGKNASGQDLWNHLGEASKLPVSALMKSWIEQPGFPVVSVSIETEGPGTSLLGLEQRRFFSSPKAAAEGNEQSWDIPMVVRFEDEEGEKEHRFIFSARRERVALPAQGKVKWCHANRNEIGFYRVQPAPSLARVLREFGPAKLPPVEQMGFIEDQWALVRNGSVPIEEFYPSLEAFAACSDHNVLRAVSDRFFTLDLLLKDSNDTAARKRLWDRIASLFAPQLELLGYEPRSGEPQNDVQRRSLLIHALGALAHVESVIRECEHYAEKERTDSRSVDANLAGVFVGIAAKYGDEARYDTWFETYRERKARGASPQECLRYLHTLSAFRPEVLTRQTLEAIETDEIPQEAAATVLRQLLGGRHSQLLTWSYLKEKWTTVSPRLGDMGISHVVESLGALKGEHREDIVSFFAHTPPHAAERALARALERMDQLDELAKRVTPALIAILR